MTSNTDLGKSTSLGIGITKKGQEVIMIGTESKDKQSLISIDGNSQLGRTVRMLGIDRLDTLDRIPNKQRKDIIKSYKLLPLNFSKYTTEIIKNYKLLPLNFSKYTTENVYVEDKGGHRLISIDFVNKDLILIQTHHYKCMTNGWDIDFDNPDNEEWYEYGIIDFGNFKKLHKVIEKDMIWFHKFDEVFTEQRRDTRYESFEFMDIRTEKYYHHLCKEEDKLYNKVLFSKGQQNQAFSIEIEKEIFASMKSVQYKDLFDFDSAVYEED